ncbi:MAG: hypothetical protein CL609_16950 [Anaerolineaceae bacterium]|nr:hypothetical protein [Anaerolineaceae bacterium]
MKNKIKLLIPIVLILFVTLACSLPGGNSPSSEEVSKLVETAAAGTITALAPSPTEEIALTPVPDLPEVSPTLEIIPTNTPEPVGPPELRLVYNDTNGHVWVWSEGSSPLQIVSSGNVNDVRLSPDGEWVVFRRTAGGGMDVSLWAIRFNGSDEHLLIDQADFNAMALHPAINADDVLSIQPYQMKFIPGSQTLAFNTYPQFEGPGLFDNKDLWLVDVETGTLNNLLPAGQAGHFHFSPDGSQIALVTPEDISLINTDGSNRRSSVLTYPFVYTYSEYAYHAEPVWAPDGSYLRVTIPPQDSLGDPSALGHIYQIPTDGSSASLLGNLPLGLFNYGQFSPDLTKIAYLQQVGDPVDNAWALLFANYDGSGSTEFTRGNISFLSWAPDANHFAFEQRSPRAIVLGQTGSAGTTLVDANPSLKLSWISENRYFFLYQTAPEDQIRLGTLGSPSTVIASLGDGSFSSHYDYASPE